LIPLGHIAGIPVEETALSFGPVLLAAGGFAVFKLRTFFTRIKLTVASRNERRRPVAR
jgi:hypothetical protein